MTQPQHLPASAYRIGMRVNDRHHPDRFGVVRGISTKGLSCKFDDLPQMLYEPSEISPVLRPVTSLTDAEARAVFVAAFGDRLGLNPSVTAMPEKDVQSLRIVGPECSIWISGHVGTMYGYINETDEGIDIAAHAILDYLDQIGADGRGWIERGLAVAETVATETTN